MNHFLNNIITNKEGQNAYKENYYDEHKFLIKGRSDTLLNKSFLLSIVYLILIYIILQLVWLI